MVGVHASSLDVEREERENDERNKKRKEAWIVIQLGFLCGLMFQTPDREVMFVRIVYAERA